MRRIAAVVSVAAVSLAIGAFAAAAGAAGKANIVLGQSIGPVKLGDTEQQLVSKFGRPTVCGTSCKFGKNASWSWLNTKFYGRVSFNAQERVNDVYTNQARYETSKGIHPSERGAHSVGGSTIAEVRQAYPTAQCPSTTTIASDEKIGQPFPCTLTAHYKGRETTTLFTFYPAHKSIANGVTEIEVYLGKP